jgi:hypothetical protein
MVELENDFGSPLEAEQMMINDLDVLRYWLF